MTTEFVQENFTVEVFEEQSLVEIRYEGLNATALAALTVRVDDLEDDITTVLASTNGDLGTLSTEVNALSVAVSALTTDLSDEETARIAGDAVNAAAILATEAALTGDIDAEIAARAAAITAEEVARDAAIAAAIVPVTAAHDALAVTVSGLTTDMTALGASQTALETSQSDLSDAVDLLAADVAAWDTEFADTNAAILAETAARAVAEAALDADITVLEGYVLSVDTGKLLGRSTAGTGPMEELTVGSGLALAAGTLSVAEDHGNLSGLSDDDHTQYLTSGRHAAIDAADHGSDVAADGQVLTADGLGGSAWEYIPVPVLDDLTDVNAPTPGDGDVLTWDDGAGEWVAAVPTGGSGAVATDTIFDAKGDLAVGTGADTAARLPVGTDGQVLTADSAEATGTKWATNPAGVTDHGALTGLGDDDHPQYPLAASTETISGTWTYSAWTQFDAGAGVAGGYFEVVNASGASGAWMANMGLAADTKWWGFEVGTTGDFYIELANDAGTVYRDVFRATRTAAAVTTIVYGNSTDNPAHTFYGVVTINGNVTLGTDNFVTFDEHASAPSTPSSGQVAIYAKADGLMYSKDDAGTETLMSGGAGGGGGGSAYGALQFVGEAVVAGSAATNLTISGLDLSADGLYEIEIVGDNALGSSITPTLTINGDTTATNYYRTRVYQDSTTVNGVRANNSDTIGLAAGEAFIFKVTAHLDFDTRPNLRVDGTAGTTTGRDQILGWIYHTTATNLTSLTLTSSTANGLSVGTRIRVWKRVADATVGDAANVIYDNATSGLAATDVQAAIDEVVAATPLIAVQAADLVITSNATYQDTDLALALEVGTYLIESDFTVLSHATPDMYVKQVFTGTLTSIQLNCLVMTSSTGATSHETALFEAAYTTTSTGTQHWSGIVVVSVAGTFKWQTKQGTSSATSVTFYAGSFLRATKIA